MINRILATIVCATHDYYPVLAYSDEGFFALDSSVDESGLSVWISEISEAITKSQSLDESEATQIALEWMDYSTSDFSSQSTDLPEGNSPEAIACRNRLKELNDTYYQLSGRMVIHDIDGCFSLDSSECLQYR